MAPDPELELLLTIPFRLRGRTGQINVCYGINRDALRWGFDRIVLGFDPALTHGFPVCMATIAYDGEGYNAVMGWIQVVTVEDRVDVRTWVSVDTVPIFWEVDNPFVVFGYRPTLYDAPGPNPPRANERWVADSFLAVCGGVARERTVFPVAGFRWGYDLDEGVPSPFLPTLIGQQEWAFVGETLWESFPTWAFEQAFWQDAGD